MKSNKNSNQSWNVRKSREFYNILGWSNGYFDINKDGKVTVKRGKYTADKELAILDIVEEIKKMGYATPMIIRFKDIIKNRVQRIIRAFADMKKQLSYTGNYTLIYPVKVNQFKSTVDSLLDIKDNKGFEAGSKPELLAVLSVVKDNKTPIICNGYKDKDYLKTALIARKLGRNITIVIEKPIEAKYVVELAKELDVKPLLGVRFRLALTLSGKWAHSGGEKSKFGLNTTQLLDLVKLLKKNDLLKSLHLLHCHQGSQIANVHDIYQYINELSTMYVELYKLGAGLKIIDVGGGLAVDYEGSRTRSFNSTNYSLGDYAHIILSTIKSTTDLANVPLPDVYSESGRAVTAHHAVFVTNIVDVESVVGEEVPEVKSKDEDLLELENLLDLFDTLPINEIFTASTQAIESIHARFSANKLPIEKRAIAEQLYSHIKLKLIKQLNREFRSHRELYDILDEDLAKKVIANFSLFQSMPDAWAISQLFPIMPLSHLENEPRMRAIIEDITCDSDGKISNYLDYQGNEPSIKLPVYDPQSPYLLAVFLVGAYQEIMGNMHNLFGPVNTAEVSLDGKGGFTIDKINSGFTNADSLEHVGYDRMNIAGNLIKIIKTAKLSKKQEQQFLANFESMLKQHTYLSS
ncbi:MAG: biosynthetic arginine decarboxylase [Neisseriaceae bacterium]